MRQSRGHGSTELASVVSVRFDAKTHAELRRVAKAMNLPYTVLVRLAVTRFLALPDEWQPHLSMVYDSREHTE